MSFFPDDIVKAAQATDAKYFPKGPYASVTLAQWAVESAYGTHEPLGSNNPFGVKAIPGQQYVAAMTREVLRGHSIEVSQKFAKYPTVEEAFEAHAHLLATSSIYREAQNAPNLESYVRAMAKHYATAPNYADVILGLIHSAHLIEYDVMPSPRTIVAKEPSIPLPAPKPVSSKPGAATAKPPTPSKGTAKMGNFFKIMSALLADVPEALSLIQSVTANPVVADIEKLLASHTTLTTTPGQSLIIEPNNSVPKTGVAATVTTAVAQPLNPSGAIGG